ncbi:MAG: hypothetical protein JXM69_04020 [Anaerolineae bacterium]|nr:hypothetical protein [Anaerolineae bacterium]
MDMQAVLKAGGIGAVVLIVLTLLGYIPCVGCITFILSLVVYVGIGVLAAYWMAPPRTAGKGAGAGAVATALAALIAGFVGLVINGIYFMVTGSSQFAQTLADLPPEQLAALSDLGVDPTMLAGGMGIAGVLGIGAICCGLWLFIAAGLGAVGGAIWGSGHPN